MKTLIHVTSDDDADLGHAMRSASLLLSHDDLLHENVTILPHRRAVALVTPDSSHAEEVASLLEAGVTVKAGATCLDAVEGARTVLPGVEVVPSGVSEVVRLQAAGYNYVKVP